MRKKLLLTFMLLGCTAVAQHFRFAQLTDIHLNSKLPERKEQLAESIQRINSLDSLDFVLITGDISDDGDRPAMMEVKRSIDRLRVPYYIVTCWRSRTACGCACRRRWRTYRLWLRP